MFIPTITGRYELDHLLLPYLERLGENIMASVPEILQSPPRWPAGKRWIDSGGFLALQPHAHTHSVDGLGELHFKSLKLNPQLVDQIQQQHKADVRFTLDFPCPRGFTDEQKQQRWQLNEANACWALKKPRQGKLYACIQPGQNPSTLLKYQPDGIALGGLAPYSADREYLTQQVGLLRSQIGNLPLHVFGIGHPESIGAVIKAGATSTDSSSAQRTATSGKCWNGEEVENPSPAERLNFAIINLTIAIKAGKNDQYS